MSNITIDDIKDFLDFFALLLQNRAVLSRGEMGRPVLRLSCFFLFFFFFLETVIREFL